jgi:GNAT superfamily N-acetyltransferase
VTQPNDRRTRGARGEGAQAAPVSYCSTCSQREPAQAGSANPGARRTIRPRIRPIAPTDSASYRSILERTTAEDLYCRFFHVVDAAEIADVKPFVEPRPDAIGFIAEDGTQALGAAHAFFSPDRAEAEIAIVVARDARRCDVGHALLERLIDELRARKCRVVSAYSLSGNSAFSHLARSVGMRPTGPPSDVMTWTLAASA